ncbi:hypothetical protein KUTeg_017856 [Tegillarca granosa]|uniref:Uncharacterized protein n=1 Tax=Tegillarca granosa TaxID=220873 RepID=A0ABQ9ELX9_TEGGR|nr:hypothetical protein KUTeg_017856 [Tegillarca granosa]
MLPIPWMTNLQKRGHETPKISQELCLQCCHVIKQVIHCAYEKLQDNKLFLSINDVQTIRIVYQYIHVLNLKEKNIFHKEEKN